jgi:hypothetical protein
VECLAGETEVLRKNLPQRRFVHHKSHKIRTASGPPATNRLTYGTARLSC